MKRTRGLDIATTLEDLCSSARLGLMVYDMQAGILGQIKDGESVTKAAAEVLAAARRARLRTLFTRHVWLPKSWMGSLQYRTAMTWQRKEEPEDVAPWFLRGSTGFEIIDALKPTPDEAVFDKLAMSAFEGTPLAYAMHDCSLKAVAIVGVATEIGIDITARHAVDLGFIPIIVADACGAGDQEAGQRALETLRFTGDAIVTNTASLIAQLEKASAT